MLRRIACAAVILGLGLSLSVAMAEEVKGRITKVDDKKVTITGRDKQDKTYDLAEKVKVFKMVKDEKEELKGGIEALTKALGEKGQFGKLVIDDDSKKVTEIYVLGGRKRKDTN